MRSIKTQPEATTQLSIAALNNPTGSSNIALGNGAGLSLTTGSCQRSAMRGCGEASQSPSGNRTPDAYIAGIYKVTAAKGVAVL
jgi:hypothetical protein